jgi:hypothetical protein
MVNANGADSNFNCECHKYDRDGLLCCHVLKVFIHLGIDAIPERYIKRRWTQKAIKDVSVPTGLAQDDVMPELSRKKVRFANLSTSFLQMAKLGSESEQAEAIARRHIREMKTEFSQLNKVWRKKNPTKTTTTTSNVPPQTEAPSAP